MRVFKFLLKFTFICNLAFLLFVFFRWMERHKPVTGSGDKLVAVPFFKDLVITLGVSAIVINLLMNIFYILFLVNGKWRHVPVWLPLINFIFLIIQFIFFFA